MSLFGGGRCPVSTKSNKLQSLVLCFSSPNCVDPRVHWHQNFSLGTMDVCFCHFIDLGELNCFVQDNMLVVEMTELKF